MKRTFQLFPGGANETADNATHHTTEESSVSTPAAEANTEPAAEALEGNQEEETEK